MNSSTIPVQAHVIASSMKVAEVKTRTLCKARKGYGTLRDS